jgi:hypothetical protein
MNPPMEHVSSWRISLSPDEQHVVLSPWVANPPQADQPVHHYVLTLDVARLLHRQLAESIQQLEGCSGEASTAEERRKVQQPVANDRRKSRRFEGSPPSGQDAEPPAPQTGG